MAKRATPKIDKDILQKLAQEIVAFDRDNEGDADAEMIIPSETWQDWLALAKGQDKESD